MDDYAKSIASSAKTQGQDVVNSFNPTSTASNQLSNYNNLIGSQQAGTQDYAKQFADTIAKNPSVTDLYNQGNAKFNVPQLQTQATNLNNQVAQVLPNAYQQARGFDFSDSQAQQQANVNSRFLTPAANAATANANTAAGLAQGYVTAGQAQNAQNLLPIQSEQQFLLQQQGGQQNAYNTANTNEFNGLNAKLQAGVALTQAEYDRYNQLLQSQTQQSVAQTGANASIQAAKIGQTYQTLNPAQTVYNTQTGAAYSPVGVNNINPQLAYAQSIAR